MMEFDRQDTEGDETQHTLDREGGKHNDHRNLLGRPDC